MKFSRIIGQAAGVAAKLALDAGKAVQDVDTAALAARLKKQQAVLDLEAPAGSR